MDYKSTDNHRDRKSQLAANLNLNFITASLLYHTS